MGVLCGTNRASHSSSGASTSLHAPATYAIQRSSSFISHVSGQGARRRVALQAWRPEGRGADVAADHGYVPFVKPAAFPADNVRDFDGNYGRNVRDKTKAPASAVHEVSPPNFTRHELIQASVSSCAVGD